jgi:hypothetical protein
MYKKKLLPQTLVTAVKVSYWKETAIVQSAIGSWQPAVKSQKSAAGSEKSAAGSEKSEVKSSDFEGGSMLYASSGRTVKQLLSLSLECFEEILIALFLPAGSGKIMEHWFNLGRGLVA